MSKCNCLIVDMFVINENVLLSINLVTVEREKKEGGKKRGLILTWNSCWRIICTEWITYQDAEVWEGETTLEAGEVLEGQTTLEAVLNPLPTCKKSKSRG